MPLTEGSKAPDFSLQSNEGKTVSLADLRGQTVVLYFYPKDDTPGCTQEACDLRDRSNQFEGTGAVVLGASPDSVASHKKFRTKFALPFPLLADPDHAVAEAYGVWAEKSMYGRKYMGIERTTFVIDGVGVIRRIFPKVKVTGHADEVLAVVKALSG